MELSVTFVCEETRITKYWFNANVPGHNPTNLRFGLTRDLDLAAYSNEFKGLERAVREKLIKLARDYIAHSDKVN